MKSGEIVTEKHKAWKQNMIQIMKERDFLFLYFNWENINQNTEPHISLQYQNVGSIDEWIEQETQQRY